MVDGLRRVVLLGAFLACGGGSTAPSSPTNPSNPNPGGGTQAPSVPTGPFALGSTYADPDGWIEYQPGNSPLVLIAPHGGTLTPTNIPDRTCAGCETANDLTTQDLARQIADSFAARTGRRPHLVVNRLSRRKFDANREIVEATGGFSGTERAWGYLHAYIDTAKAAIVRTPGKGLVLDLHGHGHAIARLEVGYLLTATQLRLSDATLTAQNTMNQSSIARMTRDALAGESPVALLNGPNSLGGLLAAAGVPSVPSHLDRAPSAGEEYFSGGYNTQRHGSVASGTIDAIQIEHNNEGIRDTSTNRGRYAGILATALVRYFDRNYGWR
jgi:N-formylglutamate amidohydrolase